MNHWSYKTDRAPQDDCKNVFTMRLWEPIPLRQVESKNVFFVFCFFVFLVLCDEVLKVSISRELYVISNWLYFQNDGKTHFYINV